MAMAKPQHYRKARRLAPPGSHTIRETVESIVLALILAFLFRTFEAEAFVIPTGSMAPTLQGRHKDIRCPKCGYEYRTGASEEVDDIGQPPAVQRGKCHLPDVPLHAKRRSGGCGQPLRCIPRTTAIGSSSINLPTTFPTRSAGMWWCSSIPKTPKPTTSSGWSACPTNAFAFSTAIFTRPRLGSDDFQIARKPPEKLRAMLQPVYDNDYVVPELIKAGLPARWQPWSASLENQRRLQIVLRRKSVARAGLAALSAHFAGRARRPTAGRTTCGKTSWTASRSQLRGPSLIDDFYAYNDADFSPPAVRAARKKSSIGSAIWPRMSN